MMKRLNNKSKREQISKPDMKVGIWSLGFGGFGTEFSTSEAIDYERIDSYT